ncbi:unnamed protein product [Schistosoma curassoni]|uniref:Monocarboxylate transporter n=1 Tax=Schistosoma curassoni TaxID=6186 RepID=A0A183K804_9TREM|nr:unnamed protein product [Schistosoma curassoni]
MEAFQEVFECGSAYLFLAGGLIYTLMYCLSLVNHLISKRYGSRPVVMVGAFGSCISLLIASCLANGISVAGVSVGQMVFPSLITTLNTTYGARGGGVIMAAICLHLLITAALMPRHIIDPDAPVVPAEKVETGKSKRKSCKSQSKSKEDKQLIASEDLLNADKQSTAIDLDKKLQSPVDEFFSKLDNQRDVVHSVNAIIHSSSTLSLSRVSVLSLSTRHVKYLTRGLLIVYIVGKTFGDVGDVSVSFIAPVFGTELALSPTIINRAIAVAGVGDLITRVGVGWLTDRPACVGRRGLLLAVTWIIEGLNAFAFAELNRLYGKYAIITDVNGDVVDSNGKSLLIASYFICSAIHGICSGTAMTQMVVVLCDWVGSSQLAQSLAVTMVILGLVISPGQFLMGFVADYTGTFVWSLRICGVILLCGGFTLFLEFPVRRLYPSANNHHDNNKSKPIEQCVPVKDIEAQDIMCDNVVNGLTNSGKCHSFINSTIPIDNNLSPLINTNGQITN